MEKNFGKASLKRYKKMMSKFKNNQENYTEKSHTYLKRNDTKITQKKFSEIKMQSGETLEAEKYEN